MVDSLQTSFKSKIGRKIEVTVENSSNGRRIEGALFKNQKRKEDFTQAFVLKTSTSAA